MSAQRFRGNTSCNHHLVAGVFLLFSLMLSNLPAELLLRIIQHIPSICDKCQLLQTCRRLHHVILTHAVCWSNLDLSPYDNTLNNSQLLNFLRRCNIKLNTNTNINDNTITTAIHRLDLSGCWSLSEDLIVALSKSLTHINELCFNGYRLNANPPVYSKQGRLNPIAFEQQRDHVYQVRPSHDLSSMAMDLSKKSSHQLKVPSVLLNSILENLPYLTRLSVQYQDLSTNQMNRHFSQFKRIRHLDVSCCIVSQPALQALLRVVGPNLETLKMLNIGLTSLTLLCLSQFCVKLRCLHVSCNEPHILTSVCHTLSCLFHLEDFRLTRLRTGSIDPLISRLNPLLLKRLDLSPKMNIYPKNNTNQTRRLSRERKHPPQSKVLSISNYATTEHCLQFSDASLGHLAKCHQLVELRLCFPAITSTALHQTLQQLPQLEILELRQRLNKQDNYLTGLKYLKRLKELDLYSVNVTRDTIRDIMFSDNYTLQSTLQHMTLSDIGYSFTVDDINVLLSSLRVLQTLCLGHLYQPLPDSFGQVKDVNNVIFYKLDHNQWRVQ